MRDNERVILGRLRRGWRRGWTHVRRAVTRQARPRRPAAVPGEAAGGITYVEIAMMLLIVGIMVVSIANAVRFAARGSLAAKERSRALSLARDRLEEVKRGGYEPLVGGKVSLYVYPDNPDPANPLTQRKEAVPYPATPPAAGDDPWGPETILDGAIVYWRHVVVKFVEDPGSGEQLRETQQPGQVDGTYGRSNLAYVEVDVTWYSRRAGAMEQVRVSTLIANTKVLSTNTGEINGTVYDDDGDRNGADGGQTAAWPGVGALGSDDRGIYFCGTCTGAVLRVRATNTTTNDTFFFRFTQSYTGNSKKPFTLVGLPFGTYEVDFEGAPLYYDSWYNGYTSGPLLPPGAPDWTLGCTNCSGPLAHAVVTIDSANMSANDVSIWTWPAKRVTVHALFDNVVGTLTEPQYVTGSINDGLSDPVTISATVACNPCAITIPNVAWSTTGTIGGLAPNSKKYTLRLTRRSSINPADASSTTADIYVNAWTTPSDFIVGRDPTASALPDLGIPAGTYNNCPSNDPYYPACVDPRPPLSPPPENFLHVSELLAPAEVHVKVMEHFNSQDYEMGHPLVLWDTLAARIKLEISSIPSTTILPVTANYGGVPYPYAEAVFKNVPAVSAGQLKFTAYICTATWYGPDIANETPAAGYTTDTFFNPFDISGGKVELQEDGTWSAFPSPTSGWRHTFKIMRVSTVSGTIWEVCGGSGTPPCPLTSTAYDDISVQIANDLTGWSSVVKSGYNPQTGAHGVFFHPAVPVENASLYKVVPLGGEDNLPNPMQLDVSVPGHGQTYWKDTFGVSLEFVMSAVNGVIKGTVLFNGAPVANGATVIASTHNTGTNQFLTKIPDPTLNGKYAYSGLTLTDGTFKLKVTTGVGPYYLYVSTVINGVRYDKRLGTTVLPAAGTDTVQDITLP